MLDQGRLIDIPSLEVKAGEIAALVGPVDSGREEVFQLLTRRMHPATGSVRLAGLERLSFRYLCRSMPLSSGEYSGQIDKVCMNAGE